MFLFFHYSKDSHYDQSKKKNYHDDDDVGSSAGVGL